MEVTSNDESTDVWGYVRLSQSGREDTIEEQKAKLREYCRRRDDIQLVTTLSDGRYTSGFNSDRDAFQTLIEKVEGGNVDGVVVRDRARLARDFDIRLRILRLFRERDVDWHVVEEMGTVDIHKVDGAAMETMKAAMDHKTKKAEMERARKVVEERLGDGEYQGRPWTGTEFDDASRYLVASRDDEWDAVMEVVERWKESDGEASKRGLAGETGLSRGTVRRVIDRTDEYRALEHGAKIGWEGRIIWPDEASTRP